ncbi:amino acid ABC transporter permease [Rhodobacter sp. 24-YEA-8]|uniref:amino acid ABC transporter permease n=1 Tax=Rhodobacter sp. 24-YEA-8 TaxID=1884310 RepID=UPI000894AC8C|nr:amino acid ABC transporter permease [Rhodobacter sp. 24-YEA-8]SEC24102.1 amino acid ABC transporter membrane protein, PAAT family [Rhodobacter sp. 24-YEA-8]
MSGRRRQEAGPDFPWWLLALGGLLLWLFAEILSDEHYRAALVMLSEGIRITVLVSLTAFAGACLLGLVLAMMALSQRIWLRQIARFYVELMRGIPMMVLLLYVAFALAPLLILGVNRVGGLFGADPLTTRDFPLLWRAVLALVLAYSAFLAEIFRAGIGAVNQGQVEAADALGLSRWQRFRLVVFPQAFRLILPPLGNDFIAMVKDSSLVAVLGVTDIAQLAKVASSTNFRYMETYNVAAMLYLVMTLGLSLVLRWIERRLAVRPEPGGSASRR